MARVTGLRTVIKALQEARKRHGKGIERGLKKAGLFLQAESQKIVPVDLGPLRASAFTRASGRGAGTEVRVGYTAAYAVYVHENLDARHGADYNAWHGEMIAKAKNTKGKKGKALKRKWHDRGPNQQAKFLERPLRNNRKLMAQMVIDEARK